MKILTLAAIDIGSNAIRLLISNVECFAARREFKKTAFIRVPIRLGEDVFFGPGEISAEKTARLAEALEGFSHLMKAYGVSAFRACATSAMREAKNSRQVCEKILGRSGVKIEVIGGGEEADILYRANAFKNADFGAGENCLYMDVGGGSTEFVAYNSSGKVAAKSFGLGAVRLLKNPAAAAPQFEAFDSFLEDLRRDFKPSKIIGSGGNISRIAKLISGGGEEISPAEMKELYGRLSAMSFEDRVEELGLNTYRADVIIPALEIFMRACEKSGAEKIAVPKIGLVNGIIVDLLDSIESAGELKA